jgi:hypothetical protein
LAGGLNVHGFAAGDPVNFSDPFGLRICLNRGHGSYRRHIRQMEQKYDVRVEMDDAGCVGSWSPRGKWHSQHDEFTEMFESPFVYVLVFGRGTGYFGRKLMQPGERPEGCGWEVIGVAGSGIGVASGAIGLLFTSWTGVGVVLSVSSLSLGAMTWAANLETLDRCMQQRVFPEP